MGKEGNLLGGVEKAFNPGWEEEEGGRRLGCSASPCPSLLPTCLLLPTVGKEKNREGGQGRQWKEKENRKRQGEGL